MTILTRAVRTVLVGMEEVMCDLVGMEGGGAMAAGPGEELRMEVGGGDERSRS